MNKVLKIFTGVCFAYIVARLVELHFQKPVAPPATTNNNPVYDTVASGAGFRKDFPALRSFQDSTEMTLAAGRQMLAEDPSDTDGLAGNFLLSLCDTEQFQAALEFANEAPADLKEGWLRAVFTRWARSHPQDAVDALASIGDESERNQLFQTIAGTWVANDPSTLAGYAESLPDGDEKTYALNQVVDNWSVQDPEAFSAWLGTSPSGVNLDQAIAKLISNTDEANRSSEIAMGWVEAISDPTLRYNSLLWVLGQWNQSDPAAAQNYVNSASWLSDSQRQEIAKTLQPRNALASVGNGD